MFELWVEDNRGSRIAKEKPRVSSAIAHHNLRLFLFFTGDLKGGKQRQNLYRRGGMKCVKMTDMTSLKGIRITNLRL